MVINVGGSWRPGHPVRSLCHFELLIRLVREHGFHPAQEFFGYYLKRCAEEKIRPHPARFPAQLPEFFIKFLTDEGDVVLDPFAGSCTKGEAAERHRRKWSGFELRSDYLDGAHFRFEKGSLSP